MTEFFDWDRPGLNWAHFHSLANLLSLRNGGQAEPAALFDTVLEQDWKIRDDGDEDSLSVNTALVNQISDSGHSRLKKRFLDGLAGFAANEKGGKAVACSAMKEAEDDVVIWLARNDGFSDEDQHVFDELAELLDSLSCNDVQESESLLWKEMVSYHSRRIKQDYISDLRLSFKAYDAAPARNVIGAAAYDPDPKDAMSVLQNLLFDSPLDDTSIFKKHANLVLASYDLRRTRSVEEMLNNSTHATSKSKRLWQSICLCSRLRVAYCTFIETVQTLPSFARVKFVLVPRSVAPPNPSQPPLTLKQTFKILDLYLNDATREEVLVKNCKAAETGKKFASLQKQKPYVHAEVQMLVFLAANEPISSDLFPYFGCSKLSCFMCSQFLQAYGRFTTRGCHGRLFKPWTVPCANRLLQGHADRMTRALVSVQNEIKKKLKESVKSHVRHERTSIVGGSSIMGERSEENSSRRSQIDQLRMKSEYERVAESFRRQTEDTASAAQPCYSAPNEQLFAPECNICDKPTNRKCSVCNKDFFCSERCEKKMSWLHLFTCSKRPLTSADFLWKSIAEDLMPQEEDVLEDFGFNNAAFGEGSYLLGLYQGLYLSGKFSAEDLHEWRIGGTLAEKIEEFYYGIPERIRGGYFPWYLKNRHVLGRPVTKEEANQHFIATFFDKARPYLDAEDRNKTFKELKPKAKGASYALLAAVSHQATPNPIELNWYSFGFVTCRGKGEESTLVQVYQLLLLEDDGSYFFQFYNSRRGHNQPVGFTQFWKAYESGTLTQLMDSKGLKGLRSRLPFLEAFMSVPPSGPRSSVWDLKQFLDMEDPARGLSVPSVSVDYGFINCRTFEETCTLMEIYRMVFQKANPLDLHQACITGTLWQFASGHVQMEERWRPLMKNVYPWVEPTASETSAGMELRAEWETDEEPVDSSSLFSRLLRSVGIS